jgi:hypothetical protein
MSYLVDFEGFEMRRRVAANERVMAQAASYRAVERRAAHDALEASMGRGLRAFLDEHPDISARMTEAARRRLVSEFVGRVLEIAR